MNCTSYHRWGTHDGEGTVCIECGAKLEIRADFDRRGWCICINGEPVGRISTQYKQVWFDRKSMLGESNAC